MPIRSETPQDHGDKWEALDRSLRDDARTKTAADGDPHVEAAPA